MTALPNGTVGVACSQAPTASAGVTQLAGCLRGPTCGGIDTGRASLGPEPSRFITHAGAGGFGRGESTRREKAAPLRFLNSTTAPVFFLTCAPRGDKLRTWAFLNGSRRAADAGKYFATNGSQRHGCSTVNLPGEPRGVIESHCGGDYHRRQAPRPRRRGRLLCVAHCAQAGRTKPRSDSMP